MINKKVLNEKVKEIAKNVEKRGRKVASTLAGIVRDELTEEAFSGIVKFYTSYSPKNYKRHYYNFMENSFTKYYSNAHGTIYRGGVKLTPGLLDDIYQDSTFEVFETVYSGYHGPASMIGAGWESIGEKPIAFSIVPEQMWPSPTKLILDKRDYIKNHINDYIEKAKKKVNIK